MMTRKPVLFSLSFCILAFQAVGRVQTGKVREAGSSPLLEPYSFTFAVEALEGTVALGLGAGQGTQIQPHRTGNWVWSLCSSAHEREVTARSDFPRSVVVRHPSAGSSSQLDPGYMHTGVRRA